LLPVVIPRRQDKPYAWSYDPWRRTRATLTHYHRSEPPNPAALEARGWAIGHALTGARLSGIIKACL